MWVLTSYKRAKLCQGVLDACVQCRMTSRGILWINSYDASYDGLRIPANWTLERRDDWGSLARAWQWCLGQYPDEKTYAWLSDDTFPLSEGFDVELEKAAGDWCFACGHDNYIANDAKGLGDILAGKDYGAPMVWGGKLMRAVGWWALPNTHQAGSDTAWSEILQRIGAMRYCPHVKMDHRNYKNKAARPKDEADSWTHDTMNYVQDDFNRKNEWVAKGGVAEAIARIYSAKRADACGY